MGRFSERSNKKAMEADAAWVQSGDRSHPNLKLIDETLRPRSTYPGHADDLRKLEDFHFAGDRFRFERTRHKVIESQRVHEGDRSHRRLELLDALCATLTYPGWEEDRARAEADHLRSPNDREFDLTVEGMKRKQAMDDGDRTHDNLRRLDALDLSYPNWEADVASAERLHARGYGATNIVREMSEKQRMHGGDRSHPRLVGLDALTLTYPGWERDVAAAEKQHLHDVYFGRLGVGESYAALLRRLERRQREFATGAEDASALHPVQRAIVETKWTYPGFEADVEKARNSFHVALYEPDLERCRLRQMIHDGDFGSHPALIEIDAMRTVLTYPGCKRDLERVTAYVRDARYYDHGGAFRQRIQGLRNKQAVFAGVVAREGPAGASNVLRRLSAAMLSLLRPRRGTEAPQREQGERCEAVVVGGCCVVCMDAPRTHVFVPCGHMCACQSCGEKLMKRGRKCPVCAQAATIAMEVFLP